MSKRFAESKLSPLRNTGQLYIPQALTDHPFLGFAPGDDVRMRVLPCGAVLAWPAGELPTDTLVVPPPDPADIPWPLSSTGATYDELATDSGEPDSDRAAEPTSEHPSRTD